MKTIADFKRKLIEFQENGKTITMIHHQKSNGRDEKGDLIFIDDEPQGRRVKKVLATQVCFEITEKKFSYLSFPKAKEVIFDGDKMTILCEDYRVTENPPLIPIITYIF